MDCLKVKDPEEYDIIKMLYARAIAKTDEPDWVRVAPVPENKAPAYLIDAWGLEMFRIGLEMGLELADTEQRINEDDE